MQPSPNDLSDLLFRTTADDLPAHVEMADTSTHETTKREFRISGAVVATVHMHWRGEAKVWCPIAFEKQEPAIYEMLRRIAVATRQRVKGNEDEAKDVLNRLNLAMQKA